MLKPNENAVSVDSCWAYGLDTKVNYTFPSRRAREDAYIPLEQIEDDCVDFWTELKLNCFQISMEE